MKERNRWTQMVVLCASVTIWPLVARAAESLTAEQIAKDALETNLFSTDNASATIDMDISKSNKVVRQRRILTKMKRVKGETRSFVEFQTPADVSGTRFLSIEEGDETQQFIYLPAFKKVKRIVGAQRTQSFMGTDFSYADLEGRDVDDSTWKRLPDDKFEGEDCYVLEAIPKTQDDQQYSRTVMWVHSKTKVPLKIEFFDLKDKKRMEKRLTVKKLSKKSDRWISMDSVMETPGKGTETRLKVVSIDLESVIPDDALTRAALER